MSTRSSIYYKHDAPGLPGIHIYRELLDDAPDDIHMEISTPHALINILLPVELQEMMGIGAC